MRILVTGARGFVMSVFLKRLAEELPAANILAVDISAPDEHLKRYLGSSGERTRFRQLDVRNAEALVSLLAEEQPQVVVHGATVTHVEEWEKQDPARYIDVNVMGTVHLMEAVRRTPSVHRFLHVSSAAVYGSGEGLINPIPEDAATLPDEMYGISKVSAELIVHRYGELFGIETPTVRFTKVFGAMERPSPGRSAMSLPFYAARALVQRRPLCLTSRTLQARGDWLSAIDITEAMVTLCCQEVTNSTTYNLASGTFVTVEELLELFEVETEIHSLKTAEVDIDPSIASGKNGTFDIARARSDLNWKPRTLKQQATEYSAWARSHAGLFTA